MKYYLKRKNSKKVLLILLATFLLFNIITNSNKFFGNLVSTSDYDISRVLNSPLIFIGGYARSGTTLMRAILDVHDDISCGPETKILPRMLKFLSEYKESGSNLKELNNSGITSKTMDSALGIFVYHIMRNHIRNSKRLCAKDPDILKYMAYLKNIFPNSKFIYMVRDARAVVYSLMKRLNETFDQRTMHSYLITWAQYNFQAYEQCESIGFDSCKIVRYEDLVSDPNNTIRDIAAFVDVTWSEMFLNHEKYVGDKIVVSDIEWSTEQIKHSINIDSLYNWVGNVNYNRSSLDIIEFVLEDFGYNIDDKK